MHNRVKHLGFLLIALMVALVPNSLLAEGEKEEREGGIIGTGIVGTITELGSIIVNAQRVTFEADDMAVSALGDRPAADLRPGETVIVAAYPKGANWQAQTIEVFYPVIGPVDLTDGAISVMGTGIDVQNLDAASQRVLGSLRTGDWIAVNGLWKDARVQASTVSAISPTKARISGSFMQVGASRFVIGETVVAGLDIKHAEMGDMVSVSGEVRDGGIAAESVRIGLFSTPMRSILIEGYLSTPDSQGVYTVLGSGFVAFTDDPAMAMPSEVQVFCIKPQADLRSGVITPHAGGFDCQ